MAGIFWIMAAASLWALDTLIRYPLLGSGYTTVQIVTIEHLILVAVFSPILFRHRERFINASKQDWLAFLVIGGLGSAIGTLAFTKAFSMMNPTLVILLQKLQPLVAIGLAHFILKERITKDFWLWAALCISGSLLMIAPDLKSLFANTDGWYYSAESSFILMGYAFTLVAVIAWGASTVFGKMLSHDGFGPSQITAGRFTMGFLVLIPFYLMNDMPTAVTSPIMSKIAIMVLISGILGMYFYYRGLRQVKARHATLAEMFFPVAAVIINWIYLDIELTTFQVVGAVVLIAGSTGVRLFSDKDSASRDEIEPNRQVIID